MYTLFGTIKACEDCARIRGRATGKTSPLGVRSHAVRRQIVQETLYCILKCNATVWNFSIFFVCSVSLVQSTLNFVRKDCAQFICLFSPNLFFLSLDWVCSSHGRLGQSWVWTRPTLKRPVVSIMYEKCLLFSFQAKYKTLYKSIYIYLFCCLLLGFTVFFRGLTLSAGKEGRLVFPWGKPKEFSSIQLFFTFFHFAIMIKILSINKKTIW